MIGLFSETKPFMKTLFLTFIIIPFIGVSQHSTLLELSMYDHSNIVIHIDTVKYNACSQILVNTLQPGEHQLKVFKRKQYFNSSSNTTSSRLIPVFKGEIVIVDNKCTSCIIDKFHQNNIVIK